MATEQVVLPQVQVDERLLNTTDIAETSRHGSLISESVWTGTLAAMATALMIGLAVIALGAVMVLCRNRFSIRLVEGGNYEKLSTHLCTANGMSLICHERL
jgi:hypothetical protein